MCDLLEYGQERLHSRPVQRVLAGVGQAEDAGRIEDEIAAQLVRVALDAAQLLSRQHQLEIMP